MRELGFTKDIALFGTLWIEVICFGMISVKENLQSNHSFNLS